MGCILSGKFYACGHCIVVMKENGHSQETTDGCIENQI